MSDVAIPMLGEAMQNIKDGIAKRSQKLMILELKLLGLAH